MGSHRRRGYRSYGRFKLPVALAKFQIAQVIATEDPELYRELSDEFLQKREFSPSHTFNDLFALGRTEFLGTSGPSERLRKSWLIWPFLVEIRQLHPKLKIWEEVTLVADPNQSLTGEPDYVVTKKSNLLAAPYCIIIEAKQMDFSQGWGQALTAMKGAQILNKQESGKEIPIYGVVSTGDLWQFGKLKENRLIMYPSTVMNVLEGDEKTKEVLMLLDIIFCECEKNITA